MLITLGVNKMQVDICHSRHSQIPGSPRLQLEVHWATWASQFPKEKRKSFCHVFYSQPPAQVRLPVTSFPLTYLSQFMVTPKLIHFYHPWNLELCFIILSSIQSNWRPSVFPDHRTNQGIRFQAIGGCFHYCFFRDVAFKITVTKNTKRLIGKRAYLIYYWKRLP